MRTTIPASTTFFLIALAASPLDAQSRQGQVNKELGSLKDAGVKACSLLTNAEIRKVTGRNEAWELSDAPYDRNSLCDFSGIVTIRVYPGDSGPAAIDAVLKNYQMEKEKRLPVSGFGNGAFVMYPTPRNQYADTFAMLVGRGGTKLFMITLVAPDGSTAESVRPQLLELAGLVRSRLE